MAFLTDRTLATGVTSNDLIHIVITGDTSQNPAGSSYKATMGQVLDLINPTTLTGGTYDPLTGTITFYDDSGGSFNVTGLVTGYTNTAVTGFSYDNANTFTILENDGTTHSASFNIATGLTINGDLLITGSTTGSTLNISSTPSVDNNLITYYLTRDSSTGDVKTKIIPGATVYGLFAMTGNSTAVSATTSETTIIDGGIGTLSVPINGFSIGDSFRADFGGLLSAKNNDTLRIRVKSGAVVLADSGTQTMTTATNDVWGLSLNFTIRNLGVAGVAEIVTLGTFHTTKQSNGNQTGFAFNTLNNTTFDTTISNTLDVTAEWSTNSSLNSIYSDIFVLNKIF